MPGTLLIDDWRDSIESTLRDTARNAQRQLTVIADAPRPQVQAPDPNAVMQSLQGTAQNAFGGIQQVSSSLQQTAQNVLGGLQPFNPPQPTPPTQQIGMPTPSSMGMPAPPAAVSAVPGPPELGAGAPTRVGQGQSAFIQSLQPLARNVAARTGIDPNVMIAIAANETGWGQSATAKDQNNLFSIQGPSGQASRWATYRSPEESFQAFADLISQAPRYKQAWADRADPERFVDDLRQAGYVADEPGFPAQGWVDQVKAIQRNLPSVGDIAGRVGERVQGAARDISQFGDSALSNAEAYAACGPAAAVRFAERFGRNPSLREALDLAKQVGWTVAQGMAGITSQQKLMTALGVPTKIVGPDLGAIEREAQSGNPVTISTPFHYFYADAYDPASGAFHVGRSGTDLRGGAEWMTASQIQQFGQGAVQGALFADSPLVPSKSQAVVKDQGGSTDQQAASVRFMGQIQPVGAGFPGGPPGGGPEGDQERNGLQVIGDAVGTVANDLKNAVGGFVSDVGAGAQGVVQDVSRGATDIGRQIGPNLGFDDAELERRRAALETDPNILRRGAEAEASLGPAETRVQPGAGQVAGALLGGAGSPATPGPLTGTQAEVRARINQDIEEHPAFQDWPVPVAAGVGIMATQMLLDPMTYATWGPLLRGGAAAGRMVADVSGKAWLGKLTTAAVTNGLQNAVYEAQKPNADPLEVGKQFAIGAIGGSGLEFGTPALIKAGRAIIERLPELAQFRQRGELDLGLITGAGPTPRSQSGIPPVPPIDPLHGQAVPRPGYASGSPEHEVDTFLQDKARAQGTPRPDITAADIAGMPGMAGTRSRGLQEVREAAEVGLPAARWYQEMVQQIRQDTGLDINPREAAVLLGATGGNAGVQANYHAALSIFDAMRQVKPDLVGFENLTSEQIAGNVEKGILGAPEFEKVKALVRADSAYIDDDMLARVMRGYRTGEVPVPSGAKLSSYTQDFLHALSESYSPYSTQDVHQGRLFGARPDVQNNKPLPNVSQNDQAYRTMHALTNWVAREMHLPPDQAQAAAWTTFRTLWTDPIIGPELRNDRIGLSDAIRQGRASGVLDPTTMRTGGLAEVTGPRGQGAWGDKINDVRDRIRANGSFNTPPPDSATAAHDIALYHPSIQSAAQQRATLDPSGFQYGKVSGPKTGISRPVGDEPAAGLRELALGDQPILRVPGEVQTDANGKIPWLAAEHTVQTVGDRTYVSVVGVGDDAAHVIGQRLGADRFNHADPTSTTVGGYSVDGVAAEQRQAVVQALAARGLPVLEAGSSIRVPVIEGSERAVKRAVDAVIAETGATDATLVHYEGESHAVRSAAAGANGRVGDTSGAVGPSGLSAGDRIRSAVFRDQPLPPSGAVPPGTGIRGAIGGGDAGAPSGVGVDSGGRLGGFQAPTTAGDIGPIDLRVRSVSPAQARKLVGGAYDPGGRVVDPRSIGEVHSNPHTLREAGPDDAPLSEEALQTHADQLDQRYEDVTQRLDAVDELLRNPTQKVERPPWAAGYTNRDLAVIAHQHDVSPYAENWWDAAGLETGSGEVRESVGESNLRGRSQREPTTTELRQERNALAQEQKDLLAASDQLTTAPAGVRFAARPEGGPQAELPFDVGTEEAAPHGPYATEGSGPSGVLASDIVTKNGTLKKPSGLKTLWSEPGQVVGREGGVTGRGIADAEAAGVAPPSEATLRAMPNLDALLKEEVPDEVRAQIQKAVEDNPELFAAYNQGRISHDSLKDDLARKVGMSTQDWLKTKVGQGFSTPELVALQAAAVDMEHSVTDMAREIMARQGGVDALSPEEVAFGVSNLADAVRLLGVARGARGTQGRSLNALKIRMDRTLARGITGANEAKAARRTADQARRGARRATQLLNQTRDLEQEKSQALARLNAMTDYVESPPDLPRVQGEMPGTPAATPTPTKRGILDQIADAYDQLDRYQAMTLHEKADVFDRLAKERAERAAARKAKVREAPQELLSALKAELAAEQKIFAGRKNTWETMAFWDSEANAIAAEKRRAFKGGLYLEAQRKAANNASKLANREAEVAWERASKAQEHRDARAKTLLEGMGGVEPNRALLKAFTEAVAHPDPMVAAKFLKGLQPQRSGFGKFVDIAKNANIMRLAGMLSATATHLVNTGGNAIKVGLVVPEHTLTVGYDIARSKITGGERQEYMAALGPMLKGWFGTGNDGARLGALASLPDALKILQTGISPSQVADLSTIRPGFRTGLPGRAGEVTDAAIEMPLRALQAEDLIFRGGAFGMHAQRVAIRQATREGFRGAQRVGRANNIVANLEDWPELYLEAAEAASHMVYQERRTVMGSSGFAPKTPAGELGMVGLSQVVPFRKTPINITAQGLGYSPLGIGGVAEAIGTRGDVAARIARGEIPASRLGKQTLLAEQRAARATIGSAILASMYLYGTQRDDNDKPMGNLTAMYDEDEASTYPPGWRAWSFRTQTPAGVVYTPFQNFGHAGAPMALAAIMADAERRGKKFWSDDKEIARAAAGLGRYALDTPFLQGLSDAVELLHDPGRAGTKAIEGLVASYGPYSGLGRQIQRAQGVASRNPREGWNLILDALEADYPGLSGNVPEATTTLGDARTPGQTGVAAFVSPLRYDIEKDEPTLRVLRDNDVTIGAAPKTVSLGRGQEIPLTEAEQDTFKRARGANIREYVAAAQKTEAWSRSDLTMRNAILRDALSKANEQTKFAFYKSLAPEQVQERRRAARELEPNYIGGAP